WAAILFALLADLEERQVPPPGRSIFHSIDAALHRLVEIALLARPASAPARPSPLLRSVALMLWSRLRRGDIPYPFDSVGACILAIEDILRRYWEDDDGDPVVGTPASPFSPAPRETDRWERLMRDAYRREVEGRPR